MRCKPGDIAWIIQSPDAPENLWKLVRVLKPHRDYLGCWLCEALQPIVGFRAGMASRVPAGGRCGIDDKWLKPLPPDEATEDVAGQQEVEA